MSACDQPSPPPYTRRPWDEILQEFAEQTGRPIWPVTRVTPSGNPKTPLSEDQKQTARRMYRSGVTVEEISREFGYSPATIYTHLGRAS